MKALQVWVAVGGLLTTLLGVGIFVLSAVLFFDKDMWGPGFTSRKILLLSSLIFAMGLAVLGALGFKGARLANRFCLLIYCIGGGFLIVGLFALSVTSFLLPTAMSPTLCLDPVSPFRPIF